MVLMYQFHLWLYVVYQQIAYEFPIQITQTAYLLPILMANLNDKKLNEMLDHVLSLQPADQKKYVEALRQKDPALANKIKDLICLRT